MGECIRGVARCGAPREKVRRSSRVGSRDKKRPKQRFLEWFRVKYDRIWLQNGSNDRSKSWENVSEVWRGVAHLGEKCEGRHGLV